MKRSATKFRRLLPTLAGLLLGFAVLLWVLSSLQGVLASERVEARASLTEQRRALAGYALRTLEQRLDRRAGAARQEIERALADPLFPAGALLLVVEGEQLLPRRFEAGSRNETSAEEIFQAFAEGHRPSGVVLGDSPRAERLTLQRSFDDALRGGSPQDVEKHFRAVLAHRLRFQLAPDFDLPATLGLLERFARASSPAPELVRALLRDGLADRQGRELEGLAPLLLTHRGQLTSSDFHFLAERLSDLAQRFEVPSEDFLDRCREPSAERVPLPLPGSEPALTGGGRWLVLRDGATRLVGISIRLDELLAEVGQEMRGRTLIEDGDKIVVAASLPESLPLSELTLEVVSERLPRQLADVERRYRLKTGLVVLCAVLAAIMAVMAVALQVRRHRLLELRSEFVATVSHELRTPLASVRLMAETVAHRTAKVPGVKDYPERIVREVDGLAFLVDNILSFNRLERGRLRIEPQAVDLEEIVDDVRAETLRQTERQVLFTVPRTDAVLQADAELLKLLLLNLARNSTVYNDHQQVEICVAAAPRGDGGLLIRVGDNGRGIPEGQERQIFDDFYRPPGSVGSGTGLGLAICRRVMELHRGKIRVASSGPEGTVFELDFPHRADFTKTR
jgi:two-component system sensor histidine kinase SenX3